VELWACDLFVEEEVFAVVVVEGVFEGVEVSFVVCVGGGVCVSVVVVLGLGVEFLLESGEGGGEVSG